MSKVLSFIFFIALLNTALADTDRTDEFKTLTQQRFDANSAGDRAFYERLLMPNFVFLAPFTSPQTKQEYLDAEFLSQTRGSKASIQNFRALIEENTAITTYEVIEPTTLGDQQFESHSIRVDTYIKIDNSWRLLSMSVAVPPTWPDVAVIDTSVYREYAGTYELTPQIQIAISNELGHLMLEQTDLPKVELFPESQTSFFDKTDSPTARNIFERDTSGKVVALLYRSSGQELRAKKIK